MKKRLLSILLMCCMVLTLLPTAAFAEGSTEEPPVCTCETACTAENMNADCPICGAEGASAEDCGKYVKPADDVPTQPESEPVVLNSEGETENVTWIDIGQGDTGKLQTSGYYKLTENIDGLNGLEIGPTSEGATITLDLNGYTLTGAGDSHYTLWINQNTTLTIIDSSTSGGGSVVSPNGAAVKVFTNAVFTLESGIISGGVVVGDGSTSNNNTTAFTMEGGSITGGLTADGKTTINLNAGTVDGINLSSNSTLFANGGTVTGLCTFYGTVRKNEDANGTVFNGVVVNATGKEIPGTLNGGTVTGSGSSESPFLISNAAGLKWFRDKVNSATEGGSYYLTACAKLMNDIVLDSSETWTPIAPKFISIEGTEYGYVGTFDGGGHTISGLNVTGDFQHAGLFGVVSHNGTIKNLTVAGNVSSRSSQCYAGGIVGYASNAVIKNCSNHCSVSGGDSSHIGGIAGCNFEGATIIDCYNVGTICSSHSPYTVGGIAGHNSGTISNCYNVGTVSNGDQVGEIVGFNFATVENCYYLDGLGLNAVGKGSTKDNVTKTAAKSETEFADGTVLALLKAGERGSSEDPWADECKHLAAAGKTLPVFKWQGVALTEKDDQQPLTITGDTSVIYGEKLTLSTTGGSGTGAVTYTVTNDTGEATIDANGVLTPNKVGSVSVIATKAGDNDYNDVTSAPFVLMIKPATPTGAPNYTKITTGGKTLEDAALTTEGSTLKPNDGKLEWVDDEGKVLPDTTKVEANTTYKWRFTPDDGNYTTLTGEIELYHRSSGGSSYSYYTIKATAGTGGSISPSGDVSVREGRDQTFTITPDKGYAVSNVKIDGKSIGAVKSYTFENVSRTHTIEVIFMKANGRPACLWMLPPAAIMRTLWTGWWRVVLHNTGNR